PSPPTGHPTKSESSREAGEVSPAAAAELRSASPAPARPRRGGRRSASGRRLFAFDRRLGTRLVAGADEAGRGSLTGPLVAASVEGAATSAAIAAASSEGKVTRDRYMRHADAEYPGGSFAEHVGYSTPEHREAVVRNGVSPLHRLCFQSLSYQQLAM